MARLLLARALPVAETIDIDFGDLDVPLVFVRSRITREFELNPGNIQGNLTLLNYFLPGFRLVDASELNKMIAMINNLTIRQVLVATQRVITAPGDVLMALGDYQIILNKTVPQVTNLYLPSVADWVNGGYSGPAVTVKDLKGNAGTYPCTLIPATVDNEGHVVTDKIDGLASWQVGGDYASVSFRPLTDLSGWYVA